MGRPSDPERMKKTKKKDVLPTKVVVRRLPQGLTKEEFLAEVGPLPEYDYLSFYAADHSYETAYFSRAYINFTNFSDIHAFKNKFDHHNFVSSSGVESLAVVELALFRGVPRSHVRKRKDPRSGTIENDSDYQAFLESLEKEKEPPQSAEVYLEQLEARKAELKASKEVTPLIEFIKSRRAARNAHKHAIKYEKRSRKDHESEKESRSQRKKQDEPVRKSTSKKPLSNKPNQTDSKPLRESKRATDANSGKSLNKRGGERNQTPDKDSQSNRSKPSSKQYNNNRSSNRPSSSKGSRHEKTKYNPDNSSNNSSGTNLPVKKSTNSGADDAPPDKNKSEDAKKTKETSENTSPRDKSKRKNKDRPEMAIYRPPSRPSSGKGKDSKSGGKEKSTPKDRDK